MRSGRFRTLSRGSTTKRGERNKTEAEYELTLEAGVRHGTIVAYWFEPITVRLSHPPSGQPATYTPDFMVLLPDGRTYLDDVKGSHGAAVNDAARVRIKAAAEQFPLWVWRLVTRDKTAPGGFSIVEV